MKYYHIRILQECFTFTGLARTFGPKNTGPTGALLQKCCHSQKIQGELEKMHYLQHITGDLNGRMHVPQPHFSMNLGVKVSTENVSVI